MYMIWKDELELVGLKRLVYPFETILSWSIVFKCLFLEPIFWEKVTIVVFEEIGLCYPFVN